MRNPTIGGHRIQPMDLAGDDRIGHRGDRVPDRLDLIVIAALVN